MRFNAQKFNCTSRVQDLIKNAALSAKKSGHSEINFLHLFASILTYEGCEVVNAVEASGKDLESISAVLDALLPDVHQDEEEHSAVSLSPESIGLFHASDVLSKRYNAGYISVEHIFIMMNDDPDESFGIFLEKIGGLERSVDLLNNYLATGNLEIATKPEDQRSSIAFPELSFLPKYSTNINDKVRNRQISTLSIDPDLVRKVYEILARRNKNNPLIIGEAGVGKTALVECVAQTIVDGTCPDLLSGKKIYSLDLAGMISGCNLRGDFEERVKGVINEVINRPDIIIFIDEIHTLVGAGDKENGFDAANILKPYLARGEFTCIGATTLEEYKFSIAKDAALERRFQTIVLEEPSKEKTKLILTNIVEYYQDYHNVSFPKEIIDSIVCHADRYLQGRFPDKAIDILDQVGSKLKLKAFNKSPEMSRTESEISKICRMEGDPKELQGQLSALQSDYFLETQKMVTAWREKKTIVSFSDIIEVISDKTRIPKANLERNEKDRIEKIKIDLRSAIVGQDGALDKVYASLIKKYVINKDISNITSFLFSGPNNCGKLLTAKTLCRSLYPATDNFIILDMSAYSDKSTVFRLIGSPPGYEGHRSGGFLTEKVRNLPNSVVVFRGIDKACPEVLSIVSNILKDGEIHDSLGRLVKFKNCIVVLTTTTGAAETSKIGFGGVSAPQEYDVIESLKKYFSSELIDSLDEVIMFNALSVNSLKELAAKELEKVRIQFEASNICVRFNDNIASFFAEQALTNNQGARSIPKKVDKEIGLLVAGNIPSDSGSFVRISSKNKALEANVETLSAAANV
jgi:ATP-dependent Clp protease ATP-binding subunit ClpC